MTFARAKSNLIDLKGLFVFSCLLKFIHEKLDKKGGGAYYISRLEDRFIENKVDWLSRWLSY